MQIKRILCLVLVFAMIVSWVPLDATAAGIPTITATVYNAETAKKPGDTITVTVDIANNPGCVSYGIVFNTSENITYSGITKGIGNASDTFSEKTEEDGSVVGFAFMNFTTAITGDGTLATLTFTVNEDVSSGDEVISFEVEDFTTAAYSSLAGQVNSFEASYSIASSSGSGSDIGTTTSGYDIFYTLDSETDVLDVNGASGTDNYMEYGVVDGEKKPTKVTATVKLKNNGEATTLQAYDVYLTYDTTGLKYVGHNMSGAVAYEAGSETAIVVDETAPVVSHIQAVSESFTAQTLGQGAEVTLGTITFEILPAAVYDQELHITLTEGTGSKTVTNISVGGEAQGDQQSYYPTNTSTVLGAEVNTTYKVTWKNSETTLETDEKAPYGFAPIYDGAKPEKTDSTGQYTYTFEGWNTADGMEVGMELPVVTDEVTYYAAFSKVENSRTITFHANDGSETPETKTQTFTPGVDTNLEANTFEKTGHTFAGWATTADGEVVYEDGAAINVTTDTDLYAKWTPVKYNIKFVDDDNTTVLKETEVDYGTKPEAPADPTKQEDAMYTYEFAGWDPAIAVVTGDATYKATYEKTAKVYKVEWMVDNVAIRTDTVAYGATIPTKPENPSKDGYNFVDWDSIPATMPAENVVINATWEAISYRITFDAAGGTLDASVVNSMEYDITSDKTLPTKDVISKTGYTFDGWKPESNEGNWQAAKTYIGGTPVTGMWGTVRLVAQWSANPHTIDLGTSVNGSVEPSANSAKEGDIITLTAKPNAGYKLVTFVVKDANGNPVTVNNDGTFTMPDASVIVSATFTGIEYTVKFDANADGDATTGTVSDITATFNETIQLTNDKYDRVGYTFLGWSADKDADTATYLAGATITDNLLTPANEGESTTLYAIWEVNDYTVKYDKTDSAVEYKDDVGADKSVTYTENVTLPTAEQVTKEGYTLSGWNDGTDTHDPGATVSGLATVDGGEVTLTPEWTENKYTVKYDKTDNTVEYKDGVGADKNVAYTEDITLPTAAQVTKPGYTLTGWTTDPDVQVGDVPTYTTTASKLVAENNGEVTLYPVWNYVDYTVTIGEITNGKVTASKTENVHVDETITLTPTPHKGYGEVTYTVTYEDANGTSQPVEVSGNTFTMPAGNVTVTASFSAKQYTIRFELNGGDWETGTTAPSNPMTYYTTDETDLPTNLVKDKYTFTGWTVSYAAEYPEEEQGWGNTGDPIAKNSTVNGHYGNVILTAQWDVEFKYEVEEYVYAPTDYVMLRIAAASENNVYSFKYGEDDVRNMFYTDDPNYKVGENFAFVTLIPKDGNIAENAETGKWELTAAAVKKLNETEEKAVTVVRDGDVNHDDVVNIADANVVYQMVSRQEVRGSYYSMSQLDIYDRLVADMKTATNGSDKRGTLEDVSSIVAEINKG